MYLTYCEEDTYFLITELWFNYNDRNYYSQRGINEGTMLYILKNKEGLITVRHEAQLEGELKEIQTIFNYDDSLQICGETLQKKPKTKRIIKK